MAVARIVALGGLEEGFLQGLGHGPGVAFADDAVVELTDGRQFGGGAAEEGFVGVVDLVAGEEQCEIFQQPSSYSTV